MPPGKRPLPAPPPNPGSCPSEVEYWPERWGGKSRAVGYSFLLSERDMCGEPAASNAFALHVHRAVLEGLSPGGRYGYRVAGGEDWAFAAAPRPAADARFSFVAFGDLGDPNYAAAKSPGCAALRGGGDSGGGGGGGGGRAPGQGSPGGAGRGARRAGAGEVCSRRCRGVVLCEAACPQLAHLPLPTAHRCYPPPLQCPCDDCSHSKHRVARD